jgi:hypothetical protein
MIARINLANQGNKKAPIFIGALFKSGGMDET